MVLIPILKKNQEKRGTFPNWKAVKKHVSSCSKNNKEYTMSDYCAPIHILELNNSDTDKYSDHFYSFKDIRRKNLTEVKANNWIKDTIIEKFEELQKSSFYLKK